MKSFRKHPVSVNTGSMADIAFLLLIFFLVSTTISAEKGILRQLPPYCKNISTCTADIKKRNLLEITLNRNNDILILNEEIQLKDITNIVMAFVNNNGLAECTYCDGEQLQNYSEHPTKAIISLRYDTNSHYTKYIEVQDKISDAYKQLRENYAQNNFNSSIDDLDKTKLNLIKAKYPIKISEITLK